MFGQRLVLALVAAALVASDSYLVDAQRFRGLQSNDMHAEMLKAVNAERAKANLPPLCYNKKLNQAAQAHSQDQANTKKMSHTGSNGSSMTDRMKNVGFKWTTAAENVAAGQKSVADVMDSWMKSDGHRANILGQHKFFGMGHAVASYDTYGDYWTQNFGSADGESCEGGSNEGGVQPAPTNPAPAPQPKPTNPAPAPEPKPTNPAPKPQPTPAPQPKPEPTPAPKPDQRPVTPATPAPTTKKDKCKSN
ncbi:hypothetical protein PINS_up002727 [Pythium insidiosum]|nr:hypothetical protein PINS_up002727 [Pythium insidiosum]